MGITFGELALDVLSSSLWYRMTYQKWYKRKNGPPDTISYYAKY
jgi:hypothetical protein